MKGLRLYLTPFAPDQSGAVSVLYPLDGMIVLLDAGGCTGNVLGFDEPRWQKQRAAVFSAGLRDMDAIMGRDRELADKAQLAFAKTGCSFIALVGTPVPSIIGTDYRALEHLLSARCGCPVISIPTNGMATAEAGLERTYLTLFERFAGLSKEDSEGPGTGKLPTAGVIGCTPLELIDLSDLAVIREELRKQGYGRVVCYGADASRADYENASRNAHNFVLSGAGLRAARYLEKNFGTPYTACYPEIERYLPEGKTGVEGRILILQDPVPAAALKEALVRRNGIPADEIDTASFFAVRGLPEGMLTKSLREENDLLALLAEGGYTRVFADPVIGRMPHGRAEIIPFPSFAISGKRILT